METTLVENLPHVTWVGVLIKAVMILAIISAVAGFGTYIERKVLAFMQRRLGPMHVGPYGLLQIAADGIKLFTKEDIVPQNANRLIFMVAPAITAATAFIALSAVPVVILSEFENPSGESLTWATVQSYSSAVVLMPKLNLSKL